MRSRHVRVAVQGQTIAAVAAVAARTLLPEYWVQSFFECRERHGPVELWILVEGETPNAIFGERGAIERVRVRIGTFASVGRALVHDVYDATDFAVTAGGGQDAHEPHQGEMRWW